MNFVEDILAPIYEFLLNISNMISGQDESIIKQKITLGQFILFFLIVVVVFFLLRILI